MANESIVGINQKVTLGANKILGMGSWEISGGSYALHDDTEYGDKYDQVLPGLITGGTLTFGGHYKKDDTQGQDLIREAYHHQSSLTDIRAYVDSVSYYTPNSTTAAGGGLPADVPVSHVLVHEEPTITSDKGDTMKCSFSVRMQGAWRLI